MDAQPPPQMPNLQAIQDAEHLRLLGIFHYVMAGFAVLGACFASIYVILGVVFGTVVPAAAASGSSGSTMSASEVEVVQLVGWIYALMGGVAVLFLAGLAVCLFLCGRYLSARVKWMFIFVLACIQCVNMPLGTILGIFTIIVLQRPSVKALFDHPDAAVGSSR